MRTFLAVLAALIPTLVLAADGPTGTRGRVGIAFAYMDKVSPITNGSTPAQSYSGDDPVAGAYLDTLDAERDWDFSGVVGDSDLDYTPIQYIEIEYVGTGADTLWLKYLDEDNNSLFDLDRFIVPASTNSQRQRWDVIASASRVVYFAGRATTASTDEWTLRVYYGVP